MRKILGLSKSLKYFNSIYKIFWIFQCVMYWFRVLWKQIKWTFVDSFLRNLGTLIHLNQGSKYLKSDFWKGFILHSVPFMWPVYFEVGYKRAFWTFVILFELRLLIQNSKNIEEQNRVQRTHLFRSILGSSFLDLTSFYVVKITSQGRSRWSFLKRACSPLENSWSNNPLNDQNKSFVVYCNNRLTPSSPPPFPMHSRSLDTECTITKGAMLLPPLFSCLAL